MCPGTVMNKLFFIIIRLFGLDIRLAKKRFHNPERLEKLLRKGLCPDAKSFDGTPLLHLAAKTDQCDALRVLLANGASPNSHDSLGRNALFPAIDSGSARIVSTLCEYNAEVDSEDKGGFTPLGWCVIVAVESTRQGKSDLRSNVELCVAELLRRGASADKYGANENSPLMLAVFNKDYKLCSMFSSSESDPRKENSHGDCPLAMAERDGLTEFVNLMGDTGDT